MGVLAFSPFDMEPLPYQRFTKTSQFTGPTFAIARKRQKAKTPILIDFYSDECPDLLTFSKEEFLL